MTPQPESAYDFPDFCRRDALLSLAVAMQLVAICLTLANYGGNGLLLQRLLLLTLYLQWIGLVSAAVLCQLRRRLKSQPPRILYLVSWLAIVLVVAAVAEAAWWIDRLREWRLLNAQETHYSFMLRNLTLAAMVSVVLLRYLWSRQQWRAQVVAESEARFQALSARIRPHFMFNALNSLAELIISRPQQAERLVEDLADVMRASFDEAKPQVRLEEELDACRAYLRIEQLRLGERLRVDWQITPQAHDWRVPRFCLQPLVENAVYHGISRLAGGGVLTVEASVEGDRLRIDVSNPIVDDVTPSRRSGIAVQNIRRRLELLYGGRAALDLGVDGLCYRARLSIPAQPRGHG